MRKPTNMYQKGIDKKQAIIDVSRELFFEHGYNKTTVNMIKEKAGASLSAIPYYFGTKMNIVKYIYNQYIDNIYDFLEDKFQEDDNSCFQFFCVSKIFYDQTLNNPNNSRFYYEVSVAQSNYQLLGSLLTRVNKETAHYFNLNKTETEFELIRMCDSGGRREILLNYYKKNIDLDFMNLVNYITSISPNLLGVDKKILREYMDQSTDLVKNLNYDELKFLV